MNSIANARTHFGQTIRQLRLSQSLTLRALQERSGVSYTLISAYEHAERAVGPEVATRLADGLGLLGEERQRFLFAAAATRRKDRLVDYSRKLAPELVNFIPAVLVREGVELADTEDCVLSDRLGEERPELLQSVAKSLAEAEKTVGQCGRLHHLVLNTRGREFVCTLVVTPCP